MKNFPFLCLSLSDAMMARKFYTPYDVKCTNLQILAVHGICLKPKLENYESFHKHFKKVTSNYLTTLHTYLIGVELLHNVCQYYDPHTELGLPVVKYTFTGTCNKILLINQGCWRVATCTAVATFCENRVVI